MTYQKRNSERDNENQEVLELRLSEEIVKKLDVIAQAAGMSRDALIEAYLRYTIGHYDEFKRKEQR